VGSFEHRNETSAFIKGGDFSINWTTISLTWTPFREVR
jgi:hypothetical protein